MSTATLLGSRCDRSVSTREETQFDRLSFHLSRITSSPDSACVVAPPVPPESECYREGCVGSIYFQRTAFADPVSLCDGFQHATIPATKCLRDGPRYRDSSRLLALRSRGRSLPNRQDGRAHMYGLHLSLSFHWLSVLMYIITQYSNRRLRPPGTGLHRYRPLRSCPSIPRASH